MARRMKIALLGLGDVGRHHARSLAEAKGAGLAAVCDIDGEAARALGRELGVPAFATLQEMLADTECEGILIATPHTHHPEAAGLAFRAGRHVLLEKPLAIRLSDAQAMVEAHRTAEAKEGRLIFGAMFQQRTYGYWRKIKALIDSGELGRLMRFTWIITDWYRSQAYYDSGNWRATWRGEGGGVLMNQAAHNLDIYQWLAGAPQRITAVAGFGKYHRIEVEDEISIILEHESGMVGHIFSSTAEAPGTNRMEIIGDRGGILFDGTELRQSRLTASALETIRSAPERAPEISGERRSIEYTHHGEEGHRFVIEDFTDAWREGREPIAPAREGLVALEIANAAILSAVEGRPVELPLDTVAYDSLLERLASGITP